MTASARSKLFIWTGLSAIFNSELSTQNSTLFLSFVNQDVERLSADRHVGTGAQRDDEIHLRAEIDVAAGFRADGRMFHFAGLAVDDHVLVQIPGTWNVFRFDAVRRERAGEV